jgi:hypothetical protein
MNTIGDAADGIKIFLNSAAHDHVVTVPSNLARLIVAEPRGARKPGFRTKPVFRTWVKESRIRTSDPEQVNTLSPTIPIDDLRKRALLLIPGFS